MSNAVTKPVPSSNTSQIAYDPDISAWQKEGPAFSGGKFCLFQSYRFFFFYTHYVAFNNNYEKKQESMTDGPEKKI